MLFFSSPSLVKPLIQPVGLPFITTSRLIPAENLATAQNRKILLERLVGALGNATAPVIFAVAPYYFEEDGGTSVTDTWRTSLWHARIFLFLSCVCKLKSCVRSHHLDSGTSTLPYSSVNPSMKTSAIPWTFFGT